MYSNNSGSDVTRLALVRQRSDNDNRESTASPRARRRLHHISTSRPSLDAHLGNLMLDDITLDAIDRIKAQSQSRGQADDEPLPGTRACDLASSARRVGTARQGVEGGVVQRKSGTNGPAWEHKSLRAFPSQAVCSTVSTVGTALRRPCTMRRTELTILSVLGRTTSSNAGLYGCGTSRCASRSMGCLSSAKMTS